MIKNICIRNFQSHCKTKMEFCEGLNVIIGDTDSGKSAIVRALRLLILNKPLGDKFINWNTPKGELTSVKGKFTDGSWAIREKGKNINQYRVSGYDEPFSALKGKVPKEVQNITKLSEANIQSQSEYYFLLDKTGGQVASAFNKVANLDLMELVIKQIKSELTETNSSISHNNDLLEEIEKEIENLKWITKARSRFQKIEKREIKIEDNKYLSSELTNILSDFHGINHELSSMKKTEKALEMSNVIIDAGKHITEAQESAHTLDSIIYEYYAIRNETKQLKQLKNLSQKSKNIMQSKGKLDILKNSLKELEKVMEYHEEIFNQVVFRKKQVVLKEKKLNKFKKQLKVCPLCGGVL